MAGQAGPGQGAGEALRDQLIESQRQKAIAAGKGESMEALYSYITSAQFAQKVRAVVDAYQQMRDDLERARCCGCGRSARRSWSHHRTCWGCAVNCTGCFATGAPQLEDIGLLPS